MMDDKLLQQAIGLVQVGDKSSAIKILKEIVTKDPKNENAWLWLAASFDKPENKIRSLQKVLEINPNNQKAKQALDKLAPIEPALGDLVPNSTQKVAKLREPTSPKLVFIKDFLRNLAILIIIGLALYIIFPDMMKRIFQLYGALFGPIAILLLIVAALPRKRYTKHR
jgi:tetratricopeptide (TPR) repeat protein